MIIPFVVVWIIARTAGAIIPATGSPARRAAEARAVEVIRASGAGASLPAGEQALDEPQLPRPLLIVSKRNRRGMSRQRRQELPPQGIVDGATIVGIDE